MVTDKLVISGIQMVDIQTSNWWHTYGSHTNQELVAYKKITHKPIIGAIKMDHIQTNT